MIIALDGEGQIQVCINTFGGLYVIVHDPKSSREWVNLGTHTHPAIKKGPRDFNTIVLHVRKHRAEIIVNGVRVYDPVTMDWNATPAQLSLGIDCWNPHLQAEFDRIKITDLASGTAD